MTRRSWLLTVFSVTCVQHFSRLLDKFRPKPVNRRWANPHVIDEYVSPCGTRARLRLANTRLSDNERPEYFVVWIDERLEDLDGSQSAKELLETDRWTLREVIETFLQPDCRCRADHQCTMHKLMDQVSRDHEMQMRA